MLFFARDGGVPRLTCGCKYNIGSADCEGTAHALCERHFSPTDSSLKRSFWHFVRLLLVQL